MVSLALQPGSKFIVILCISQHSNQVKWSLWKIWGQCHRKENSAEYYLKKIKNKKNSRGNKKQICIDKGKLDLPPKKLINESKEEAIQWHKVIKQCCKTK